MASSLSQGQMFGKFMLLVMLSIDKELIQSLYKVMQNLNITWFASADMIDNFYESPVG